MDLILCWNEVATEADRTTHTMRQPSESGVQGLAGRSRALAIASLARHDAYFSNSPKPHGTDLPVVPTPRAFFDARHGAKGLLGGQADAEDHVFGQAVATPIRQHGLGLDADGYASRRPPQSPPVLNHPVCSRRQGDGVTRSAVVAVCLVEQSRGG